VDYLLLILKEYDKVTAFNVDDVVYIAMVAGLPIKYDFVFSSTGPKSPTLRDDILSLLAAKLIQLDPESYRYSITEKGKKVLEEIEKNIDTRTKSILERLLRIFNGLKSEKALNRLSIYAYLKDRNKERLGAFLGQKEGILHYRAIYDKLSP